MGSIRGPERPLHDQRRRRASLEPGEQIRAAHDDNYERLVEIKERWTSSNLFRMNQNIAPETDAGGRRVTEAQTG